MKGFRWLALVVVAVMIVSPLAVFAQGSDEVELVEYVSEDELLTASLPADWPAGPIEDYPLPSVVAASKEETYARFLDDEDIAEGDQYIMIMVMPLDFLSMLGVELPAEATVVDMTAALAETLIASDEDSMASDDDDTFIGEVEEVDLGDDVTGAYVPISDEDGEGGVIGVDLGDGVLGVVFVASYPGEFTDDLRDLGIQVAGTVAYEGTADDLLSSLSALMGETTSDTTGGDASALDGAALVAERCSVCHDTGRIDKADKDEAGWTATVDRMIGKGAQLDEAEREAVISYLVETH